MVEQRDDERLDTLLAAVQTGDVAAFAEIYDRLSPLVYGIVCRSLGDPRRADEVTRDAFVQMWRLAPLFDSSRRSVSSWACMIAHHSVADRIRSASSPFGHLPAR